MSSNTQVDVPSTNRPGATSFSETADMLGALCTAATYGGEVLATFKRRWSFDEISDKILKNPELHLNTHTWCQPVRQE